MNSSVVLARATKNPMFTLFCSALIDIARRFLTAALEVQMRPSHWLLGFKRFEIDSYLCSYFSLRQRFPVITLHRSFYSHRGFFAHRGVIPTVASITTGASRFTRFEIDSYFCAYHQEARTRLLTSNLRAALTLHTEFSEI